MSEHPKQDQKIKVVNHGIGIIKFALHAPLDSFSKMENVLQLTNYVQHGITKDYAQIVLKDMKLKMEFALEPNNQDQKIQDANLGIGIDKSAYNVLVDSFQKMEYVHLLIQAVKLGITKGYAPLVTKDTQFHLANVLLLTCHAKHQILMVNVHHAILVMFFIKRIVLLFRNLLTLPLIMQNAVQKN